MLFPVSLAEAQPHIVTPSGLREIPVGTIIGDLFLEGLVVSEPANPNLDDAVQVSLRSASRTQNNRTAYVEDVDGKHGVKLVFQHLDPEARKMSRYSLARVNLKDAVLAVENGGYVVREIPNGAVVWTEPGSREDIPLKERTVRTLTDEDLFTWVTLKDCEFVFKDGSYCNILETFAAKPQINTSLGGNGYMGTWQTLLADRDSDPVYAVINSRVEWRRSGNGVPAGNGSFSGLYVRSDIDRYGRVFAPQIRPLEEDDFHFTEGQSAFKVLCEWNWNDNGKELRTGDGPMEVVRGQNILPDDGEGSLRIDFDAEGCRGRDCNNPVREPDRGYVRGNAGQVLYGSLQIRTKAANWWNWEEDCGNAILVNFSTEGLEGERLALAFSFAAGDSAAASTRMCPVYWGVEAWADGDCYGRIDTPDIMIRPLPWWTKELDGVRYLPSEEAGMGLTEHLVNLPPYLWGRKEVSLRILPVRRNAYTLAMRHSVNAALCPADTVCTKIEFGSVKVMYR